MKKLGISVFFYEHKCSFLCCNADTHHSGVVWTNFSLFLCLDLLFLKDLKNIWIIEILITQF